MDSIFKVGDKVTIKRNLMQVDRSIDISISPTVANSMLDYEGHVAEITRVVETDIDRFGKRYGADGYLYEIDLDHGNCWWISDYFEENVIHTECASEEQIDDLLM